MDQGKSCNTMTWALTNHAGTHVDAPRHFSMNGQAVSDYPPEFWMFNHVELVDISDTVLDRQLIGPEICHEFKCDAPELLIIKTGYGKLRGTDRYTMTPPGISADVALFLRKSYPSVRCVGMDLISVSSYSNRDEGRRAHRAFLSPETGAPILLVEDMNLVFDGNLQKVIICPLRVSEADGAPCTILGFVE